MWDMIDSVTGSVAKGANVLETMMDETLVKAEASTQATKYLFGQASFQKKFVAKKEEELLKEFKINDSKATIINFDNLNEDNDNKDT